MVPIKTYRDDKKVKFGEHLIFDAYGCNPKLLNNKKYCVKVLLDMVKLAGMKLLHKPFALKAGSNETLGGKDPGGISAFVMIQESHMSLHSFTKRGFVTIDLYSCREFQADGVVRYLKKAFESKDENVIKMERGLKYPADNIY